jgi:hypothetical protein
MFIIRDVTPLRDAQWVPGPHGKAKIPSLSTTKMMKILTLLSSGIGDNTTGSQLLDTSAQCRAPTLGPDSDNGLGTPFNVP